VFVQCLKQHLACSIRKVALPSATLTGNTQTADLAAARGHKSLALIGRDEAARRRHPFSFTKRYRQIPETVSQEGSGGAGAMPLAARYFGESAAAADRFQTRRMWKRPGDVTIWLR
jgi:hypothetical protein